MSIFLNFARLGRFLIGRRKLRRDDAHCRAGKLHICAYEPLEVRNPLSANPFPDVHLGSVYLEPAGGNDTAPNVIQVTFQGGAPGTQLTHLVINGDKDHNGTYSSGEVFFDTAPGGMGVFGSSPLNIVSANGFTVLSAQVVDGGQQIAFDLQGFKAGDKLVFSIDVDEAQFVDPETGDVDVNAVVEGNEFQRSIMTGLFVAPHYQNAQGNALYWDAFDQNFAAANAATGTTLDLPPDNYIPPSTVDNTDLTAGAVLTLKQIPIPSTIAGKVYFDKNLSNSLDPSETGISGVALTLFQWDGSNWVTTGRTTTTDNNGDYKFENVDPGTYCVAETQPNGWFSVGSQPGTVDGVVDGTSMDPDHLCNIVILGGQDGIHYNFGECLPASVAGKVWNDTNGDCIYQPQSDIPLSGVQIDLLDANGTVVATTTTDQTGHYLFDGLFPGTYTVFEHQPQGFLQGMDMIGSVGGTHPADNTLAQIELGSDVHGVNYDFCEELPASISGKVWNDTNGDCIYQPQTDIPLSGVQVDLLGSQGTVIATTTTDTAGKYKFEGLRPGTYSVFEHQPAGYLEGMDILGTVGGVTVGTHGGTDLLSQITLGPGANGINYDFCEELPASVAGKVWNDTNGDCIFQPQTDIPLSAVQIDLLDSHGSVIATTTTDESGHYEFDGLTPGTYSVFEHQPIGYLQGMDNIGSVGGTNPSENLLAAITLGSGVHGVNYDFCEELPASVAGKVWNDTNGDCIYQPGTDIPLSGVQVDLLNSQGTVIATTTTDESGHYEFDGLTPGTYSVFEHQPIGYLQGMDMVGSVGGTNPAENLLAAIALGSGVHGVNYDFCEELPASLAGKVWNDTNGDCIYEPGTDIPLSGVQIDLLNSSGVVVATTTTDTQGKYKFEGLKPGTYSVFEHQPAGYLEGMDIIGTVGGVTVGAHGGTDRLTEISLGPAASGINYDFCEHLPNSISGHVHADPEGDCIIGPHDIMLGGVQIDLLDSGGHVIATTFTNAQGFYKFDNLDSGSYSVFEHQPPGYFDDGGDVGSLGGVVNDDLISQIVLVADNHGINYDFCEHLPNSISGYVHLDPEGDCEIGPHDIMLAGVQVDLLDSQGHVLASTTTNAQGYYEFTTLDRGNYGVKVHPLPQYFDDGGDVGSLGGSANGDLISDINLVSDNHGINYNFCMHPPASISGYVYQDGPPIVLLPGQTLPDISTIKDGKHTGDDKPIAGVTLLLYDAAGNAILDSAGQQRTAITDAKGFYQFAGLDAGTYIVRELQPAGYIDGIDTPGSTGGLAINHTAGSSIPALPFDPAFDAIVSIPLGVGQTSVENDFSEVVTQPLPFVPPQEAPPQENTPFLAGPAFIPPPHVVVPPEFIPWERLKYGGSNAVGYTWHLSIVNAFYPRGEYDESAQAQNVSTGDIPWSRISFTQGEWILLDADGNTEHRPAIGIKDATPVAGDFRGDGATELGLYIDGDWIIDVNGDGRWDSGDIWAKLGTREDQAVIGDWDGDGKDDIGIFGPAWPRDPVAIKADPGLPDPLNKLVGTERKKNVPPPEEVAALGRRKMQMHGQNKVREELIDHVFHYGRPGDRAIVGDWTGNGLRRIAIFHDGLWYLDMDGDGRWSDGDLRCEFGQKGDLPVVGDWTGDGIEKIGVYRDGVWYLDTNNNHRLDPEDRVVQLGQPGDKPAVGQLNGHAVVGVYRAIATPAATAAAPTAGAVK